MSEVRKAKSRRKSKKKSIAEAPNTEASSEAGTVTPGPGNGAQATCTHPDWPPCAEDAPSTPAELQAWLKTNLKIDLPNTGLLPGHGSPLEYLTFTFFEGTKGPWAPKSPDVASPTDCVVWANRGGGKTYLGAIATLLDMLFKRGIRIRILGGSLEQSQRMHGYLREMLELENLRGAVQGKPTVRRIALTNGSEVEVLAASQTSVRGTRVQKIRCDEVDLFDPEVWDAAQLATRSKAIAGVWGERVRGSVEALSTMHRPYGPMWDIVHGPRTELSATARLRPAGPSRVVLRWGVVDVLEHCPAHRSCSGCALEAECGGKAKGRLPEQAGHISIDDAIVMKSRVGQATWASEMLSLKPRRSDTVFPEFEEDRCVIDGAFVRADFERIVAGMDFGIRSETVVLLAGVQSDGTITVLDEWVRTDQPLQPAIDRLQEWEREGWGPLAMLAIDPAGKARCMQSGKSNATVLKESKLPVHYKKMDVAMSIRQVRDLLLPTRAGKPADASDALPPAKLRVHRRCTRLIECMHRLMYRTSPEGKPVVDKTSGFDHACDALRYLVMCVEKGATNVVQSITY